jgi:hypothetical protein
LVILRVLCTLLILLRISFDPAIAPYPAVAAEAVPAESRGLLSAVG